MSDMNRNDDRILREKARAAIREGELPKRRPDRAWGGSGNGCHCTICGLPLEQDELEIELEYHVDDGRSGQEHYHVHVPCLVAWERELDRLQSTAPASPSGKSRASSPDAAVRHRALPARLETVSINGRDRNEVSKRGPG